MPSVVAKVRVSVVDQARIVQLADGEAMAADTDHTENGKSRFRCAALASITEAVESVACIFGAGDLDGGGAVVGGIGCRGRKPAQVAGTAEDAGGQHRADAVDLPQPSGVLVEQPGGLGLIVGKLLVDPANIADQFPAQLNPHPLSSAARPKHTQRCGSLGRGQRVRSRCAVQAASDDLVMSFQVAKRSAISVR